VSSYASGRAEALPWWLVLVEGIVVALLGLILLVAPGASLVFLVWLLSARRSWTMNRECRPRGAA
jgi:uncharacterized membrane protein HdeD (DUF308 family)